MGATNGASAIKHLAPAAADPGVPGADGKVAVKRASWFEYTQLDDTEAGLVATVRHASPCWPEPRSSRPIGQTFCAGAKQPAALRPTCWSLAGRP